MSPPWFAKPLMHVHLHAYAYAQARNKYITKNWGSWILYWGLWILCRWLYLKNILHSLEVIGKVRFKLYPSIFILKNAKMQNIILHHINLNMDGFITLCHSLWLCVSCALTNPNLLSWSCCLLGCPLNTLVHPLPLILLFKIIFY